MSVLSYTDFIKVIFEIYAQTLEHSYHQMDKGLGGAWVDSVYGILTSLVLPNPSN